MASAFDEFMALCAATTFEASADASPAVAAPVAFGGNVASGPTLPTLVPSPPTAPPPASLLSARVAPRTPPKAAPAKPPWRTCPSAPAPPPRGHLHRLPPPPPPPPAAPSPPPPTPADAREALTAEEIHDILLNGAPSRDPPQTDDTRAHKRHREAEAEDAPVAKRRPPRGGQWRDFYRQKYARDGWHWKTHEGQQELWAKADSANHVTRDPSTTPPPPNK